MWRVWARVGLAASHPARGGLALLVHGEEPIWVRLCRHEDTVSLERAPMPVTRHALCDVSFVAVGGTRGGRGHAVGRRNGAAGRRDGAGRRGGGVRRGLGGRGVVGRGGRFAARAAAPELELVEAVAAGAAGLGTGIVIGMLVEGNFERAVGIAEDVATAAAVVSSREVGEVFVAGRLVANGGAAVGLPMAARWQAVNLRELVQLETATERLGAVAASRAPPQMADVDLAQAGQANEAAAGARLRVVVGIVVGLGARRCWRLGVELGRTQDGGHVERAQLARVKRLGGLG